MKISSILYDNAKNVSEQIAVVYRWIDGYLSITHKEFYEKINSFVSFLKERNLQWKSIVIIWKNK